MFITVERMDGSKDKTIRTDVNSVAITRMEEDSEDRDWTKMFLNNQTMISVKGRAKKFRNMIDNA